MSRQVPELEAPYGVEEYRKRCQDTAHLILAAYDGDVSRLQSRLRARGLFLLDGRRTTYRQKGTPAPLLEAKEGCTKEQGTTVLHLKRVMSTKPCFILRWAMASTSLL